MNTLKERKGYGLILCHIAINQFFHGNQRKRLGLALLNKILRITYSYFHELNQLFRQAVLLSTKVKKAT